MDSQVMVLTVLLGVLLAMVGCGKTNEGGSQKANLTKEEVLKISEETAKAEGFDVSKYNMAGCHYEYTDKDQTWTVFYELKPPTPPGGHFTVSVADQTKKATLARGE